MRPFKRRPCRRSTGKYPAFAGEDDFGVRADVHGQGIAFLRVHFSGENDAEDVRAQIPGAVREDGDFSFRMHRQF